MSALYYQRLIDKLEEALQDLRILERAGVDTGHPQSLICDVAGELENRRDACVNDNSGEE